MGGRLQHRAGWLGVAVTRPTPPGRQPSAQTALSPDEGELPGPDATPAGPGRGSHSQSPPACAEPPLPPSSYPWSPCPGPDIGPTHHVAYRGCQAGGRAVGGPEHHRPSAQPLQPLPLREGAIAWMPLRPRFCDTASCSQTTRRLGAGQGLPSHLAAGEEQNSGACISFPTPKGPPGPQDHSRPLRPTTPLCLTRFRPP